MTVEELPFFSLDNDFQLTWYEIANGRMNFDSDRLTSLSFNPFSVNANHKLTFSRDIDADTNLFHNMKDIPCDYYLENQFKYLVKKKCEAKSSFSTLHLNISSIYQNFSSFKNLLTNLDFQFDVNRNQ